MAIIEPYNTHKILPLAARLDAAEGELHHLTAPWWRRRLWDTKIIGAKVHNWVHKWLERRGIHLYTLVHLGHGGREASREGAGNEADSHESRRSTRRLRVCPLEGLLVETMWVLT